MPKKFEGRYHSENASNVISDLCFSKGLAGEYVFSKSPPLARRWRFKILLVFTGFLKSCLFVAEQCGRLARLLFQDSLAYCGRGRKLLIIFFQLFFIESARLFKSRLNGLKSLAKLFKFVVQLQSVPIFSILNHPCSFMIYLSI